jgi:microsomal dipeptidase-like Zn-dependent dipeptidase
MENAIIDLHCHSSLKPYVNDNYRTDGNIWLGFKSDKENYYKLPKIVRGLIQETARDSQSHFDEFVSGNIKSGFIALHPPERGWFARNQRQERRFFKFILNLLLPDKKLPYLGASMMGAPRKKIEKIIKRVKEGKGIDYFNEETYREYEFLKERQGISGSWGFTYEIVNNYKDYQATLKKGNVIPVILTIEGCHALTDVDKGEYFTKTYKELPDSYREKLKKDTLENIRKIKGTGEGNVFDKKHTPFFVTLTHMYNNFLAGHARTHGGLVSDLLDQVADLNGEITDIGWSAIEALLSRENGHRILIDVKHMSMRTRNEYYEYVKKQREKGDKIPIIASHAAMNGFEANDLSREDNAKMQKKSYFSRWSVNLSNEDIRAINESEGLIGIVVHEGRMPGKKASKVFKKLKKKISKGRKKTYIYEKQLKDAYLRLIISNIFQVVVTVNNKSGWDNIAIGSDYDGIMDPFDSYKTSGTFQLMMNDILEYLNNPNYDLTIYRNDEEQILRISDVKKYLYDYNPEEIVEKIGFRNAEQFLGKFFTIDYLS